MPMQRATVLLRAAVVPPSISLGAPPLPAVYFRVGICTYVHVILSSKSTGVAGETNNFDGQLQRDIDF